MLFSKEKAELQQRIASLEESLAAVTAERDTATTELASLRTQSEEAASAHASALATARTEHEAALVAKDAEVEDRVNKAVIDALATAGVPESQLPARTPKGGSATYEAALAEYNALTDATAKANFYATHVAPFFARN